MSISLRPNTRPIRTVVKRLRDKGEAEPNRVESEKRVRVLEGGQKYTDHRYIVSCIRLRVDGSSVVQIAVDVM